ncbi:MAG: accessory factor UbiK family protein [Acinetobacter sp.]|nr:accessory factor UbiK family protein [Acinetobacter sp.]
MLDSLVQRVLPLLQQPKQDLEHNLRALLSEAIEKMDLVSKQELERHQIALDKAQQRLDALQKQLDELQAKQSQSS